VLNAPWQVSFFRDLSRVRLWAGPFCNSANPLSVQFLKNLGFEGAIVSPELGKNDYLDLPSFSPIPLGIVISGNWPLCISRINPDLKTDRAFSSPKGEQAVMIRHGFNYWVFPNWKLNLEAYRKRLETAGYCMFIHMDEGLGRKSKLINRPGKWNWDLGLP